MPRRQYIADLATAQAGVLPSGISGVKSGEDDGMFDFIFTDAAGSAVSVTALVTDLSEYPKSHEFLLFCGENASQDVSTAIQGLRSKDRKTVFELLDIVSAALFNRKIDKDGDSQMQDSQFDDEEQSDDEDDIYDSDHEAFDTSMPSRTTSTTAQGPSMDRSHTSSRVFRERIRSDLRTAKKAGFRVGHLGHLLDGDNAYVTLSVRVAKLGISQEAMQAWQIESTDYLILVVQYPNGYKTNEQLQACNSHRLSSNLCMRVVTCKTYKPTLQDAIKAFSTVRKDRPVSPDREAKTSAESIIRDTFISRPLANMLQERLVTIIRFRDIGMDWQGAEGWYQESVEKQDQNRVPDKYFEPEILNNTLPAIVNADHHSSRTIGSYSFPLLAMQFTLRHFVRCTEFCLVCHQKLTDKVEAIKPYVCEKPLCLFQLLSLGFGPSIEHEVIAQPYVVDLLVSFCYNSAAARKLKSFPDGLDLMGPPIDTDRYTVMDPAASYMSTRRGAVPAAAVASTVVKTKYPTYEVGFDQTKLELIFQSVPEKGCPVRRGIWIVLNCEAQPGMDLHCRIAETGYFPTVTIDQPVIIQQQRQVAPGAVPPQTPATTRPASPIVPQCVPASFQVYEQDFAELDQDDKCIAICRLLDTLPDVTAMQHYLSTRHPADLSNWTARVQPHALSLLRWIVASNRSCIMQVDSDQAGADVQATSSSRTQERVYGMKGSLQFRFAMGAPDKEQRFITAVRETVTRLNLTHPTLFAFHGSPLSNWHMIIREGLNFNKVDHGRAFGDGVYHSQQATTSTAYSQMMNNQFTGSSGSRQGMWPSSVLNISSAIALNEIVNAPKEYQSSAPHLVVKQLDWIQTRYLFVQAQPSVETLKIPDIELRPEHAHTQDPSRTPIGTNGERIVIPAAAVKSCKAARGASFKEIARTGPPPSKKLKLFGHQNNPVVIDDDDDDGASVATDLGDREILLDEPLECPILLVPRKLPAEEKKVRQDPDTDFIPGTLDFTNLPVMAVPTYAQSATTTRLMKELQSLQKTQSSTPPAELGWYIDTEKIENAYQWIVELHSFHIFESKGKKLPLSEDMKKQGITSIVLEVNFNKDYPFTPPYVRVIRPRFLSLMQGGGGHIVLGGAMCMELLTNTGWSSVSSMESVLMQVRLAIASEPYARLEPSGKGRDYGTTEAAEGYLRACQSHGWQVPPGFREMAYAKGNGV